MCVCVCDVNQFEIANYVRPVQSVCVCVCGFCVQKRLFLPQAQCTCPVLDLQICWSVGSDHQGDCAKIDGDFQVCCCAQHSLRTDAV